MVKNWQKMAVTMFAATVGYTLATEVLAGFVPQIAQANLSLAQANAGIILFGNARDSALDYTLDLGKSNTYDRYYLTIKPQKFQVNEIIITCPQTFDGSFDPTEIRVRVSGNNVPLESAKWNEKDRRIEIVLKEPMPRDKEAVVVLSNVRNPFFGGLYQLDARVRSLTDIPILRYVGSWVIGID